MGDALIRLAYDVGDGIGLGHRRRMDALETALRANGFDPVSEPLGDGPVEGQVVVVDSYLARADRDPGRAGAVAAVDDLDRDLDVDLLIEPAPESGTNPERKATRVLRGLDYALIDPALAGRERRDVGDEVERVIVTTGGTDRDGIGAAMAVSLYALLPDLTVRLVIGPWSASHAGDGVEVVRDPSDFAAELASADVVVCSAGVTLLEALVLGRPVVAVATATNQRPYLDPLAQAGVVVAATADEAAATAAGLVRDPAARRRLATAARETVDGRGADRVARAVGALL